MSKTPNGVRIASKPLFRERDLRWLFHVTATLYLARVWVWHVSSESAGRSTRQLFGGYFRYLTICCLTVQVLQLTAVTLVDLTPKGVRLRLKRIADDLSCMVFVLANCVTLLFYAIETLQPGGIINKDLGMPVAWINYSVHIVNSIVAWTDIVICHPRRFSWRAFGMMVVFGGGYSSWAYFIKCKTGKYPYGFLNKLPHPHGFFIMIPICAVLMSCLFLFGKFISSQTKHIMASDVEDLEPAPAKKSLTDQQEVDALKLD